MTDVARHEKKRWPKEEEQVALPYSMNEYFAVLLSILYIYHSERKIHHKKEMFLFRNHRCRKRRKWKPL
jgi:hypothetical protein